MTSEQLVTPVGNVDRLEDVPGLTVALDFDGTLAPLAADPDDPTITPSCRQALVALVACPTATVAVVSGRQLSDLRGRVDVDGVRYVGNHGLESMIGGELEVHPQAANSREDVRRARTAIEDRLADVRGVEIEDKGLTATVHYRQTPREDVERVENAVAAAVGEFEDLRTTTGKQVIEIRPDVGWDKGSAVQRLADDTPREWPTVYVGDDTTDEDAFRVLGPDDVGVLVGDRATAATHRLPAQRDVAQFLEWLLTDVLDGHD